MSEFLVKLGVRDHMTHAIKNLSKYKHNRQQSIFKTCNIY